MLKVVDPDLMKVASDTSSAQGLILITLETTLIQEGALQKRVWVETKSDLISWQHKGRFLIKLHVFQPNASVCV